MKLALAATLLILGGTAVGCGSQDTGTDAASSSSSSPSPSASATDPSADPSADPSTEASTDPSTQATPGASGEAAPLCDILTSTTDISTGPQIAALAASLSDVGTISEMSADQSDGLQLYIGALEAVDPQASAEEVAGITDLGLSPAEETKVQDFFTYAATACAPAASAPASADPSTSPSTDAQ